jgi:DNA mismatch repair protein MutL
VAAKIAAGEVVERPASAVKELVENALDACARNITIEILEGGIRSIRVTDDGVGIPASEVAVAFERHATSKIDDTWDLQTIGSLGFRGEALPSIAAVATVTLTSRTHDNPIGHRIKLKDGKVLEEGAAGCPQGTTVTVQGLFANVPARHKFLKPATTERSRVADLVSRFAMAFPDVAFRFISDGRESLATTGDSDLLNVLASVYGTGVAQALLPIASDSDGYRLSGFVSPPSLSRPNRSYITFFVNRRWIQSRVLSVALEQAYHGLLLQARYPISVLNVIVPAREVDVNVHPTKREVRFRHEDKLFSLVQRAVREVLIAQAPVPEIAPEQLGVAPIPSARPTSQLVTSEASPPQQANFLPRESLRRLRVLGQMGDVYLVAEGQDGLYLIDQHAAHERVLFEQVKEGFAQGRQEMQSLLEPTTVELTHSQAELLRENCESLTRYGFSFEEFGERTYLLRSVPPSLSTSEPVQALREVLDLMAADFRLMEREEAIAASIACHGAVRAGKSLSQQEMSELVRQLEETRTPNTCPHGRPTMIRLSANQLEREFKRR